ncbi:OLC1v1004507C1 [Oldenlandia corymbosa var. corymbosa]|uniref:RAB6-interacting golgin n=1 Tax=Oldenlandia corymbosa var. corymbosa TaxID=529605 RepID=A0AAV1DCG0_OLDCO|nr:OLC1v1004507C1 [Oldenlandia corymbosa var. corymbosa]
MSTQKQALDLQQQQQMMMRVKNSGVLNYSGSPLNDEKEEEMTKTALSAFRAKEEEIERKKAEVRERVQTQLGRVEEETRKLAEIREELEALADPTRKEVAIIRKRVDLINRDLKTLGQTCQRKVMIIKTEFLLRTNLCSKNPFAF